MTVYEWVRALFSPRPAPKSAFSIGRDFDADYAAASRILKDRLNTKFPDNYHARNRADIDVTRNYSAHRKDAVDLISHEIALALRQGASVQDASTRAAKCAGL